MTYLQWGYVFYRQVYIKKYSNKDTILTGVLKALTPNYSQCGLSPITLSLTLSCRHRLGYGIVQPRQDFMGS